MANLHADISPTGMSQKDEVNLLRQIVASILGICQKLDDDGGVPLETYEANCYTAIINTVIEDCQGNRTGQLIGGQENLFSMVGPTGISDKARIELLYQIFNAFETLTEQLDTDVLTLSTYEANCYTAKFLGVIENERGDKLGNGTAYYWRPGGIHNLRELVDLYANIVDAIETLTEQLDDDGTVDDANYEALWFTAVVKTIVEDSKGNTYGNASTYLG